MSDANNPDFPPKRCQPSPLARLETALIIRDELQYGDEPRPYPTWANGILKKEDDFLVAIFRSLYQGLLPNGTGFDGFCNDSNHCNVKPSEVLPFPAWRPSSNEIRQTTARRQWQSSGLRSELWCTDTCAVHCTVLHCHCLPWHVLRALHVCYNS